MLLKINIQNKIKISKPFSCLYLLRIIARYGEINLEKKYISHFCIIHFVAGYSAPLDATHIMFNNYIPREGFLFPMF